MDQNNRDIDLFDAYLKQELTTQGIIEFKEKLSKDVDFADQFKLYQDSILLIKSDEIRNQMKDIIEENRSQKSFDFKVLLKIAAIFILLVTTIWIFYISNNKNETELIAQYFDPYPGILVSRDANNDIDAFHDYAKGNFSKAITKWKSEKENDTLNFYLAMSHMGLEQYQLADKYLNKIDSTSIFAPQTNWYKGLSKLALSQSDSSKFFLLKINKNEFNYTKSQQLLKSID